MKKIVFILLIFCSFLVVWGCNKNKTKCVPQKEATSDSSMRSNDDTLSLMIEHEVDDVDYGVIIKRGDKTIHRFGYKYPEDDDLVPNEERIDSCLLTDLNFDGIKEDVLFYLGSFGASGTEHFDAYVWNPNTEHYDKIEEFKDIPNPKISDKYKCILSRVYISSAENEYAKYVCTNGHLIKVAELRQYWKGNIYPERDRAVYEEHFIKASNPQPIGFSGILLAKRQNSFYCTYFLHNRNVADTKSPYPIKRLEVIRWFNQKSMVFNQSLS